MLISFLILEVSTYSHASEWALRGLCRGTLLDFNSARNLDQCVQLGRSTPGATWVSFRPAEAVCVALTSIETIDKSSTEVLSSRLNGTHCRVAGACRGRIITSVIIADIAACLDKCKALTDCAWFSFDQDSGICQVLETCDALETERTSWVTGESTCSTASIDPVTNTSTQIPMELPAASPLIMPLAVTTSKNSSSSASIDQELIWIQSFSGRPRLGKIP